MKRCAETQPQLTTRTAGLHRLWTVEALEHRLLLSGIGDVSGVRKVKFTELDGDKVQIKLSGKGNTFDVVFDRDVNDNILGIDTLTLNGTNPSGLLNFTLKLPKGGGTDSTVFVDSIVSGNANLSLAGINANNAQIDSINLTGSLGNEQGNGSFSGSLVTNRDLGSVVAGNLLANITIQGGHDLIGNVSAAKVGKIIASGGDIFGNITTTSGVGTLSSIQADDMSGNVSAAGGFDKLTLTGDLSGDVVFGKGTLVVLIGGDLTSAGSITGNDASAAVANIDAGGFTRTGIVGNVAGLLSAEGTLGLGVGGSLQGSASITAGGNLTVKANNMSSALVTLASTGGDVFFAMNTGGFAGTINSSDDVFGNGSNGAIVIRGGNFSGVINADGDVAAMTFAPTSGGFSGDVNADGAVGDITTNFFASTASVTGSSIGNLTANRGNSGDAIAAGATFHATGLVDGNIGNVTASAIGSIAIGGTFTSDHGSIGDVAATSNGNASPDHAISGATFTASEGSIGDVTATARAGHGINDSTFTAATGIDSLSATSITGDGFHASVAGQNLFTVTNGNLGNVSGTSISGDGIHGGTFTASDSIADVKGTSANGSGIGDESGAVTTSFTATTGNIQSIIGTSTSGSSGSAGDGITNTIASSNKDAEGIGIGSISGKSQFGSGIVNSQFSTEGEITAISGTTNNSNPSLDEDGITESTFRTAGNIGSVTAGAGLVGGSGIGAAIEGSLFSAGGSIGMTTTSSSSEAFNSSHAKGGSQSGPVVNGSTNTALIQNGIATGTLGHWDVTVQGGGESNSANLTAQRFASGDLFTEDVLFDYFSYVDTGNDGGGFQLDGSDPATVGGDPNEVSSSGSFTGANGNTINWTVTNSIASDSSIMQSVFTFTAQGGSLGEMRFLQYLDEDVQDFTNNVLFTRGSAATEDLELFTVHTTEVYGVSHGGAYSTSGGLVNSTFAGWAADEYNDMKPQITGSGLTVSPTGSIDSLSLPQIVHPQVGTAYGPADIVSALAWDVDPTATTATVITTLGGLPDITSIPGGPTTAVNVNGDVRNSQFLAGYDVGIDGELDGTVGDVTETAATESVSIGAIKVTGDWVNSFAASGISTSDSTLGNGDDILSAPGSSIGNVEISSNIAGITGGVATNNFQSDAIGNISADAIGIDPNSGSDASAVGVSTDFSNGTLGTIGGINANTTSQRQSIGDGTVILAGASIASITAVNDNTSFNNLNAIGAATFEAGSFIGNITASTQFSSNGITLQGSSFVAHGVNPGTSLAIGNIQVTGGIEPLSFSFAMDGVLFDASNPTVVGDNLGIGTIQVLGDILNSTFVATGDIALGTDSLGLEVTGDVDTSSFTADSDDTGAGSLAGVGGIRVVAAFGETNNGLINSTFHGGGNGGAGQLAIGNVSVEKSEELLTDNYSDAIFGSVFTTGSATGLNIGSMTTWGDVIAASFTATGNIGDFLIQNHDESVAEQNADIGDLFFGGVTITSDSDNDGAGNVGSITTDQVSDLTITGVNVALAGIKLAISAEDFTVTATTGSIGDFLVTQGEDDDGGLGVETVSFHAAVNIGDITITINDSDAASEVILDSEFIAGTVNETGEIGDITVENTVADNSSDVILNADFVSGSGGIGDVSVISAGKGQGIEDSVFRAAGTTDLTHKANIGDITVVTVPLSANTPNDALLNTVFSALGSIGTGAGTGDFHINITGNIRSSMLLAGYDIGDDLTFDGNVAISDDVLSSAVTFINSLKVSDLVLASDIIAGVDPGDDIFGNFDDTMHVIASSLGAIELGGVADAVADPGKGGFVIENPLTDRLHAIEAGLIGSIEVGGTERVTDLPGYLDNPGGGSDQVNVRLL